MSVVQEKLETLSLALVNKIEREWPASLGQLRFTQGFFGLTVRFSRITYRTACYLCADARMKEGEWRWYYTLALPSLNRTILDAIFNVVFMLEDLEPRSTWYLKSGWKEAYREYTRYLEAYADDPQWVKWITGSRALLDMGAAQFCITQQHRQAPSNWWPNPGKMVDHGVNPNALPPDRQFLQYLNDWFYRETSAQNHQSFFGFMRIGALLLSDAPGLSDGQKATVESDFYPKHRAVQLSRSVILLLSLICEIEHCFSFGLAPRAIELWNILVDRVPEAKEIYEKRYMGFWPVIGAP
jgi:hypothetical protein